MNVALRIVVPGLPVPQGSKSAKVLGRRALLYDDNAAKLKPWRQKVTAAARAAMAGRPALSSPVQVDATFTFPRPAGHYLQNGGLRAAAAPLPAVRPDLDKLLRACLDGLTDAAVWTDDSRVTDIVARKRYGVPGLVVRILPTDVTA